MFDVLIIVFYMISRFPGYASEDKNDAHKKEDKQGDEAASVRLISLNGFTLLSIVDLIRFAKRHDVSFSINCIN